MKDSGVDRLDIEQALLSSPYHRWLGLELLGSGADQTTICCPWREEMVSNPRLESTHGGILAALVDLTGLFALLAAGGAVTATADLRVDYHRAARPGALLARGRPLKIGSRISTAEVYVFQEDGELLVASGRGAYLAASSQAAP